MTPPLGAGPLSVRVVVALLPPATVLGDIESDATETGAVTVTVAEPPAPVQPATLAMTVAVTLLDPEVVETLKVADAAKDTERNVLSPRLRGPFVSAGENRAWLANGLQPVDQIGSQ